MLWQEWNVKRKCYLRLEQIEMRKPIQNVKKDVKYSHFVLFWILIICTERKPCVTWKRKWYWEMIFFSTLYWYWTFIVLFSDATRRGYANFFYDPSLLTSAGGLWDPNTTVRSSVCLVRVWCMSWRCQALVPTELWAHRRILQAKRRILSSLIPSPLLKCQTPDILFQVHSSQYTRSSTVIL